MGLPHSIEAESAVLCCALIDGLETMSRCEVAGLRPESFYDPKHALVFAALRLLESRRLPFEVYALAEVMKADGTLLQVTGRSSLSLRAFAPGDTTGRTIAGPATGVSGRSA